MSACKPTPNGDSCAQTLMHELPGYDDTYDRPTYRFSLVECLICSEVMTKDKFPKNHHSMKSGDESEHNSEVCWSCWDQHIDSETDSKPTSVISCAQCSKVLEEPEIRDLAATDTYEKYLDKATKEYLQAQEAYFACPMAGCSWGAYFVPDDGNIFACRACGARHCISCDVRFHDGLTCEEFTSGKTRKTVEEDEDPAQVVRRLEEEERAIKRRMVEEQESQLELKTKTRPCPRCGIHIDKYEGCDHVTCRRCRYEFCWECFVSYGSLASRTGIRGIGNSAHKETCRCNDKLGLVRLQYSPKQTWLENLLLNEPTADKSMKGVLEQ
ncbi:hypothetical protein Q7P37_006805 [Cladosporium fusiforme]